jgi:hypothetical protein
MTTRPTSDSERLARLERITAALVVQAYGAPAVANGTGLDPRAMRLRAQQDAAAIVSEQHERLETRRAAA